MATTRASYIGPKWPALARVFHWGSVLLLVAVWAMVTLHENTEDANFLFISLHKALGLCLGLWTLARFFNRLAFKAPADLPMPGWQQKLAHLVHSLLYVILLLMPLSGFLMTQYSGRGVNMFGLFEIPNFLMADKAMSRTFHDLHTDVFWPALLLLTAAHILGVIQHAMKGQPILHRMK